MTTLIQIHNKTIMQTTLFAMPFCERLEAGKWPQNFVNNMFFSEFLIDFFQNIRNFYNPIFTFRSLFGLSKKVWLVHRSSGHYNRTLRYCYGFHAWMLKC